MRLESRARRLLAVTVFVMAAGMIVYGALFQKVRVAPDPSAAPEDEYTLQGMELFSKARVDALVIEDGKLIDRLAPKPVEQDSEKTEVATGLGEMGQPEEGSGTTEKKTGSSKPATAEAEKVETLCPT